MDLQLVALTARNWRACADLRVQASQEAFTRSALYSIAEAQFYPETITRGVATPEGELVGFVLYGWWVAWLALSPAACGTSAPCRRADRRASTCTRELRDEPGDGRRELVE